MRFVCKEFKSDNNTRNLQLAGTLMASFELIFRGFRWIFCRYFQMITSIWWFGVSGSALCMRSEFFKGHGQHFDFLILVTATRAEFRLVMEVCFPFGFVVVLKNVFRRLNEVSFRRIFHASR